MINIPDELLKVATVKWFCSFDCTNEAVGEVNIALDNNPKEGSEYLALPICQEHLDKSQGA